ncbi:hypothetical protein [Rhodococcus sp. BP-241]|nr:hypothetical protein [Rhodococcus sp. BP-241]
MPQLRDIRRKSVTARTVAAGMAGLRSVDPEILELTSTMGASK